MVLMVKIILCFSNCSIGKATVGSGNGIRTDVLKETVNQRAIRKKTVPYKSNFSKNKSILDWVIKEKPNETHFSYGFDPRFLLCFDLLVTSEQLFKVSVKGKSLQRVTTPAFTK